MSPVRLCLAEKWMLIIVPYFLRFQGRVRVNRNYRLDRQVTVARNQQVDLRRGERKERNRHPETSACVREQQPGPDAREDSDGCKEKIQNKGEC